MTRLPAFRPRAPWWGGDLQTLRNFIVRPQPRFDGAVSERLVLPLADGSGDRLSALLQRPAEAASGERGDAPLVVLVHGLAGSEESHYMGASAAHLLARGHPVMRLNLRGAGPSRPLCRLQYHAGRSGDLRDALRALSEGLVGRGIVLVGYSLGGNLLLKFLAEYGADFPIRAAVSVSAPIDLEAASRRFLDRRNLVYQWHMLRHMKREALADGARLDPGERAAVSRTRSVWEFDDVFVAPRNGFAGAVDYYTRNMARRFMPEIRVPTLLIHALDDPWIPAEPYTSFPWHENRVLAALLPRSGGHVGFHGHEGGAPWHDRQIAAFFERA